MVDHIELALNPAVAAVVIKTFFTKRISSIFLSFAVKAII